MRLKPHKILSYLSVLLCIVFFTALLVDTVKKYNQKMTNIGIIIEESSKEEKMPMERFQEPGFTLLHWNIQEKHIWKRRNIYEHNRFIAI